MNPFDRQIPANPNRDGNAMGCPQNPAEINRDSNVAPQPNFYYGIPTMPVYLQPGYPSCCPKSGCCYYRR